MFPERFHPIQHYLLGHIHDSVWSGRGVRIRFVCVRDVRACVWAHVRARVSVRFEMRRNDRACCATRVRACACVLPVIPCSFRSYPGSRNIRRIKYSTHNHRCHRPMRARARARVCVCVCAVVNIETDTVCCCNNVSSVCVCGATSSPASTVVVPRPGETKRRSHLLERST